MGRSRRALMVPKLRVLERMLSAVTPRGQREEARPLPAAPRRLLMAKAAGLGDGVLIRSLAEHLRRRHPELEIGVLVCPPIREAMSCGGDLRVHCYDPRNDGIAAIFRILREVQRLGYDAAIDFEPLSLLSAVFLRLCRIPVRIGLLPPADVPRSAFLTHPVKMAVADSMWSNFLKLARVVDPDLPDSLQTLPLPCRREEERWVEDWWRRELDGQGRHFAAIHLGGGQRASYRRWPLMRFAQLAERLRSVASSLVVILTGTAADRPLIEQFRATYSGAVVDASGLGSLQRTALVLRRCDLLVSNDTGLMHLGAAMGTPTVGLFGPTTPAQWAPTGPRAAFVYITRVPCSPCIDTYRGLMPAECFNQEKSRCMLDIGVDVVLEAARRVVYEGWLN